MLRGPVDPHYLPKTPKRLMSQFTWADSRHTETGRSKCLPRRSSFFHEDAAVKDIPETLSRIRILIDQKRYRIRIHRTAHDQRGVSSLLLLAQDSSLLKICVSVMFPLLSIV